jgi:carbamoyl-phosphate synthase large subunit
MITVAVTAVGGGVGQALMTATGHSSLPLRTIGLDVRARSAGLYWANKAYLVPPCSSEEAYVSELADILKRQEVDVLIPGSDPELSVLAKHAKVFSSAGCRVAVSPLQVIDLCRDKRELCDYCRRHGFPFVNTLTLTEALQNPEALTFPVIVKPRFGSASVGARVVHTVESLGEMIPDPQTLVQTYLPPPEASQLIVPDGRLNQSGEISVQYFVGPSGKILGVFASVNRLKDGVPVEIVPDPDSPAIDAGRPIVESLAGMGLRGPVNLQGRSTPDGVKFFEVNVRFTGITGLRAAMGYREVDAWLWAFVHGDESRAQACLDTSSVSHVGLRYITDSLVNRSRLEALTSPDRAASPVPEGSCDLPRRIALTGASGYLGGSLLAQLLKETWVEDVVLAVRSREAAEAVCNRFGNDPRLRPVFGCLPENPWELTDVDLVINAAALRQSEDPTAFYAINVEGARRLLLEMCRAGVKRLVQISSQSVYGTRQYSPWSEMLPVQPETAYGVSKWMSEILCGSGQYGLEQVCVLRLARLYGHSPVMRWTELPHKFSLLACQGQELPVHGDGSQIIDLLHISDAARAVVKACKRPLTPQRELLLNVGGGQRLSLGDLAATCQQAALDCGLKKPTIKFCPDSGAVTRRDFGMLINRAGSSLDWSPDVSVQKGFVELIREGLLL